MTYHVIYTSKIDDDCCTVWVDAPTKEDAKREVLSEYWDVKEIIEVRQAK